MKKKILVSIIAIIIVGVIVTLAILPKGIYYGEASADFAIDLSQKNGIASNVVSNNNIWHMGESFYDPQVNENYNVFEFVEYVQLMQCSGGTEDRDLFKEPMNFDVLDDYDFEPLIKNCAGILKLGAKPHLKLGGVPLKYTKDYLQDGFGMNVYPPDDYDVYYNYIDGKLWRVDALGHRIYQVSSENDKIYINEATGVEVIKTDNITFYLDNLHYQNIEISRASTWDPITGDITIPDGSEQRIDEVIASIKASSNKIAKRVYNYYKNTGVEEDEDVDDSSEITYKQVALGNHERSSIDDQFTNKSDDEVIQDYLNGKRDYIPDFV